VAKDLHSFLEEYERAFPDEVIHVEQEISSRHEVTALVTHLEKQRKFPVLIFHRVMTPAGISPLPLVCFLMSSRKRLADLLGSTVERSGVAAFDRLSRRIDPVVIPKGDAPVKEIIEREDDVNLMAFPAPVHHEMDPGPYITGGFFTAYFPGTKIANAALQRGWTRGPREIRVCLESFSHNYMIFSSTNQKEKTRARPFGSAITRWRF
jgi:UbiD family decarboxylase